LPPGKDLIFQTKASFSGAYAAEPIEVLIFGFVESAGTGTSISTFVAVLQNGKEKEGNICQHKAKMKLGKSQVQMEDTFFP
jgi:hypothetical protein